MYMPKSAVPVSPGPSGYMPKSAVPVAQPTQPTPDDGGVMGVFPVSHKEPQKE